MKGRNKFLALFLSAAMALSVCAATACGDNTTTGGNEGENPGPGQEQPGGPQTTPEVKSVAIKYNNAAVEGELSLNLTVGTVELVPVVTADEGATYTVAWSSVDPDVATVQGDNTKATVTLNDEGETVIKAEAGSKSASFVLTVVDDRPATEYNITVSGGVAKNSDGQTITKATAGTQVTLEASAPEHKSLDKWTFDNKDVTLNGTTFTMPEGDVTATATFTDTLYPLTLVGATVTKAGEVTNPQGTEGTGSTPQTKQMTYGIAYGTQVTIKAAEAKSDETFVGWDYLIANNRVGKLGVDEYTFTMEDRESTTYTAIYSPILKKVWTATDQGPGKTGQAINASAANLYDAGHGSKLITNGDGDPDLKGLSGYRLAIRGTEQGSAGAPENIQDSEFGMPRGRGMAKLILKNHSNTRTIKIQVYASFCGILANSEVVEVGPNAVVETNFELTFGMSNTWWGASLRADVGGESDEWVNVDMVLGVATALYPNGDPLQDVGSDAQLATYGDEFDGPNWHTQNKPNFSVNNTLGYILFASWGSSLGAGAAGSDRWAGFEITNMPAYAEGTDTTYIYGRVTNMASNMQTDPKADYKLVIGTDKNDPSKGVAVPVHFDRTGDTVIFRFEVPRKNAEEKFYFFLLKEVLEDPTSSYGYGFVMHLTYNNIFNWTEE